MNRAALRVGLLVVVGVAVIALVGLMLGGRWLAATERGQLRYTTSVYGLQEGAPVVFRGVRIGQVTAVRLTPKDAVVTVSLERERLAQILPDAPSGPLLPLLIEKGLIAKLATQSLLTGLLYIDLELNPEAPQATNVVHSDPPQIPTAPNTLQNLKAQLEEINFGQIAQDVAAIASSTRKLVGNPQIPLAIARVGDAAQELQRLSEGVRKQVPALSAQTNATLGRVSQAADRVTAAANRLQETTTKADPLLTSLRQTSDELGRAAAALSEAAGSDSALRVNANHALEDVARAARSLRELSDTLERHPNALLRGRQQEPEPAQ